MRTNFHRSLRTIHLLTVLGTLGILAGCQGTPKEKPPIHINPNMDTQEKYKSNSSSRYFADGAVNRMPVQGTVHTAALDLDITLRTGMDASGNFVSSNPLGEDSQLLERGKDRYEIYCLPCHGSLGLSDGTVVAKGYQKPPSYLEPQVMAHPHGKLFDIISNGIRNMPKYDHQIPVKDRWAIVSYVKELQKQQPPTAKQ